MAVAETGNTRIGEAGTQGRARHLLGWRRRERSARTHIISLSLALMLPMLMFSGFAMYWTSARERAADRRDLVSTARALSLAMDLKLKTASAALSALATSRALQENDIESFYGRAGEVAATHHAWIVLTDPDGVIIFSTRAPLGTPRHQALSTTIIRKTAATNATQISGAFMGSLSSELQISVYVPVSAGGTVTHVLMMSMNMRELSQALIDQRLPESWTVQVMDRDDLVIARNRSIERVAGTPAEPALLAAAAQGDQAVFEAADADGSAAIGALVRSQFTGWTLAVMIPRWEISGPFYRALAEIGLAAGVLLLLGGGTAILVGRAISRPIRDLAGAALTLGRGAVPAAPRTGISEVNEVMTALADAAARLTEQSRNRSAAEAALRRSEQRFRDIAETSGDWIWETDREHRFTYFSKDDPAVFGRDPQGLLGRTRWEISRDPDAERWTAHRADLDARRPFRMHYSVTGGNGEPVHYCASGKSIFDETGEFLGYRGTTTNETEVVEARGRAERAETLLQDAIDSLSAGIVIYNSDDHLIVANESWRNRYLSRFGTNAIGKTFEENLRDGLAVGHYASAIGREEEWLAERIQRHRAGRGSIEQQTADGRWFLITDYRMRNGGICGLRVDITDLKVAQAALRASEERLDRAQEIARIGSWELDVMTKQYLWSKEMFRIRGFPEDAPQPTMASLVRTIHPEDFSKVHEWLRQLRAGGEPAAIEFRVRRPDGEERVISSEGRAIRDDKGAVTRVTGTAQDVTEARRAEAARQELEHQLRHSQKLEALGTLAGGIAHDLNNTLVPVVAMTRLAMKRSGEDGQMRQYLGMIQDAGNRARDLVKRVLAFSRNDRAERQEFSIADVACEALAMLRATMPTTISLVSDIRPVPSFVGDPTQMHQVLVNLVTNAMQAIGHNAGTVSVSLYRIPDPTRRKPATIRLTVSDTGSGMDEATARRIFEPFFTTKGVGEGTGLGLSVVHGIVTSHGGTIRVESRPGEGARFTIDLPAAAESQLSVDAKIPA